MAKLTEKAKALLDGKNFASVATLMPDGSPQVTIVWIERDGDTVVLNATVNRQRYRNLKRDPRVAITLFDMANPYSNVVIRGKAVELTGEGAEDHIDKLSMKYHGRKYSYHSADDPRVVIRVRPDRVTDFPKS